MAKIKDIKAAVKAWYILNRNIKARKLDGNGIQHICKISYNIQLTILTNFKHIKYK